MHDALMPRLAACFATKPSHLSALYCLFSALNYFIPLMNSVSCMEPDRQGGLFLAYKYFVVNGSDT